MAVLSVDLAYKSYRDIGAAVLREVDAVVECEPVLIDLVGQPTPGDLGRFLDAKCEARGISMLVLDGPQGWKATHNGLQHSRVCERSVNAPAKTGLPGSVKPRNYLAFVEFSIAVFDALAELGWHRIDRRDVSAGRLLVESFPLSAWRALGLPTLPAKAKATASVVAGSFDSLKAACSVESSRAPSHDELQAIVAGLAGLELLDSRASCIWSGVDPFIEDELWREGYIINPSGRWRSG